MQNCRPTPPSCEPPRHLLEVELTPTLSQSDWSSANPLHFFPKLYIFHLNFSEFFSLSFKHILSFCHQKSAFRSVQSFWPTEDNGASWARERVQITTYDSKTTTTSYYYHDNMVLELWSSPAAPDGDRWDLLLLSFILSTRQDRIQKSIFFVPEHRHASQRLQNSPVISLYTAVEDLSCIFFII